MNQHLPAGIPLQADNAVIFSESSDIVFLIKL